MQGVSISVDRGTITAVLGMNGSGKTTIIKCLNGLLKPWYGVVMLDGESLSTLNREQIARKVAYVPQRSYESDLSVFDAVLLGRKPHIKWNPSNIDLEIVSDALRTMGLEEYALRPVRELSGGEIQRVALARALAQEAEVLLLDEPTSSLDLHRQLEVMNLLCELAREKGMAIVLSVHDINLALRFADKFLLLRDGRVYAYGERDILTPKLIEEVFNVPVVMQHVYDQLIVIPIFDARDAKNDERSYIKVGAGA